MILENCLPLEFKILTEGKTGNRKMIIRGVFQRANSKNQNGRTYPKPILEREVANFQTLINERRAVGELDHPTDAIVNLKNVSHNIIKLEWDGDDIIGELEILPTPNGNILKGLLLSDIRVGISSRGMGSVKNLREGGVEVQDDFQLLCFDVVSNPSTQGAFLHENYNPNAKSDRLNSLIYDFLSEVK